jgi:hypothetical protein
VAVYSTVHADGLELSLLQAAHQPLDQIARRGHADDLVLVAACDRPDIDVPVHQRRGIAAELGGNRAPHEGGYRRPGLGLELHVLAERLRSGDSADGAPALELHRPHQLGKRVELKLNPLGGVVGEIIGRGNARRGDELRRVGIGDLEDLEGPRAEVDGNGGAELVNEPVGLSQQAFFSSRRTASPHLRPDGCRSANLRGVCALNGDIGAEGGRVERVGRLDA